VLRTLFSDDQLAELSRKINPSQQSQHHYYPLVKPGERFPVADPNLDPWWVSEPSNWIGFSF
jgi:hypothetical protein